MDELLSARKTCFCKHTALACGGRCDGGEAGGSRIRQGASAATGQRGSHRSQPGSSPCPYSCAVYCPLLPDPVTVSPLFLSRKVPGTTPAISFHPSLLNQLPVHPFARHESTLGPPRAAGWGRSVSKTGKSLLGSRAGGPWTCIEHSTLFFHCPPGEMGHPAQA